MDRWEIRFTNALDVGSVFASGQVFEKSVGLKKTLLAIKPHYERAKKAGKACGLACGIKNSGIGNGALEWGKVRLVVDAADEMSLYNGYTEMGQGLLTVLTQCAVESTDLPASCSARRSTAPTSSAAGRRPVARDAPRRARGRRSRQEAARRPGCRIRIVGPGWQGLRGRRAHRRHDEARRHAQAGAKAQDAHRLRLRYAARDPRQEGKLEKVVAAHDVGRAINPALCAGQIEGSVHMGLGYALTEELPCDERRDAGDLRDARHRPLAREGHAGSR